jgi:dihydroorotate dehydrogenase (NAD+) catalytic subunit
MGMAIDVNRRKPVIGNIQGGLSGPAIKPIALLKVHQVYSVAKSHGVPIIGQGGITNATDALEFLIAGASAVQVGTANFVNPLIWNDLRTGLADYMTRHQLSSVSQIVGTLDMKR